MPNDAEGENAIKKLNGAMVDGRAMNVTIARPKENSGNNSRGGFKKDNFWK
jgi:RNA recognition motif-containing protein